MKFIFIILLLISSTAFGSEFKPGGSHLWYGPTLSFGEDNGSADIGIFQEISLEKPFILVATVILTSIEGFSNL